MGYAVALKSINESAKQIESLWDACSLLEPKPSMRSLNYPPHISMAIYEETSEADLFEAIDFIAVKFGKFQIKFEELKTFESENTIVLWAKPKEQESLKKLHNEIHNFINPEQCEFYYRPKNWVAHCTLATDIDLCKKEEVNTFIKDQGYSLEVTFDVIDCVSFFPIDVRRENELQGTL